ncbi:16S rRNA (cytidine(1402)-2'-O)-methyltransferase [Candidatus Peregrinibacteria bacterium]|nr:16S rRNA (cytidine(1402)-2'-O)-methyltransferase [Candidatus Peregrinibacteria bacterium]
MLYIVATPIGNLEDITLRAIRTLREADFIVAEDTRHSGILLKKYEIATPMLSFHSHSPESQLQKLLAFLKEGKNLALISDAGTPGISDPGYLLIKTAIENNIQITSIPGPSAVINALAMSGLPTHRFLYLGYLPLKKGRKKLIASLKNYPYTIVFYEAPHRILKTLNELKNELNENLHVAIGREMTKVFEEVFRGNLSEAIAHFESKSPRGEFTIVLEPKTAIIK